MRVYIAGPMATSGEPGPNLHAAAVAAAEVIRAGHSPYVPHLTWILDAIAPFPRGEWQHQSLAWIETCGALIRLPGESVGADAEARYARTLGIPVFFSVAGWREWLDAAGKPGGGAP